MRGGNEMAKCKCGNNMPDNYQVCYECFKKDKAEQNKQTSNYAPKVEDLLKNINTGVWKNVMLLEAFLVEKGLNPKEIYDKNWERKKKEDEEKTGINNPLQ